GNHEFSLQSLDVLFEDEKAYADFRNRHDKAQITRESLSAYKGNCYLGVDAGSTTTKIVLLGEHNQILADYYAQNKGNPLKIMVRFLKDLYSKLPKHANIVHSGVTGYGEALIQSAFGVDVGEVETVAHFTAASYFDPEVEFLLDIGGQDMKCITIKEGIINQVILNEACSSGCGSFIESLSTSIGIEVSEFAQKALFAKHPMDLGTRCTVFMNSRIKQVQKEGAEVGDISAGLSYSVIKNALYKVIKLRNPDDLGGHIVVQGGTFLNDAILRATELITKREVVRPQIAGLMGAFGAALIAKERYEKGIQTTLVDNDALAQFSVKKTNMRCGKCENACLLTLNRFNNGQKHLSGNKCEKGAGVTNANILQLPNLYDAKNKLLFDYTSLTKGDAPKGTVGIPRGLNMFENYPFWHTFFTELGFSVVLSGTSNKVLYEKGLESIPSESECYPAKLIHGHVMDLIEKDVDFIFYPCIPYDKAESDGVDNHYNCPIVASYPENIKNNVEQIREGDVKFLRPFITMHDEKVLKKHLAEVFQQMGLAKKAIYHAVHKSFKELDSVRNRIKKMGEETLKEIADGKYPGIVLAGRPYHVDHEIHHGIPAIINQLGFAVLTEDAIAHLSPKYKKLRILDQWVYHSRLYAAANVVGETDNLELVQLNSFGCGLDAVTTDQVEEILKAYKKTYTVIKIDEVSNLGAARIRLRSLKAAIDDRKNKTSKENARPSLYQDYKPPLFQKHMKTDYTVIAPQMSPIHFSLLEHALRVDGLKLEILPEVSKNAKELGLKYVNNDACYPTIIVIGQLMEAIESGKYDLDKLAVIMSQTGGSCRASNYLSLLRKALSDKGLSHIPAISLSDGLEKHPGFKFSTRMLVSAGYALIYGDLFNRLTLRTRPYEKEVGQVDALHKKWEKVAIKNLYNINPITFSRNVKAIIREFEALVIDEKRKPRVGVVGEILVKFHPGGNNQLVASLEELGAEASVPDLYDFLLYSLYSRLYRSKRMIPTLWGVFTNNLSIEFLELLRRPVKKALKKSSRFDSISTIREIADGAKPFLSIGNQSGEGWFLTGEMVELIHNGVENIVCAQPFACLPNHIMGKGTVRSLRDTFPHSNIIPIDYDPGDTNVNQINRIELMLSIAREREVFKQG
ncbi:MAG: 2-hydroxyacyl-CoA dehydratase, partial [Clostridiales bacterium]|nr:2-hydroxyacyl-CoA dehydratase [Clostridiales bacterium]